MLNETTTRNAIHAHFDGAAIPTMNLAAVRQRAAGMAPEQNGFRKRRVAWIAVAIAIPAIAFAASPTERMMQTLLKLSTSYGTEPKGAINVGNHLAMEASSGVTIDGKAIPYVPIMAAIARANQDFHVVLPKTPAKWGVPKNAYYDDLTGLSYTLGGSRTGDPQLSVSIQKRNPMAKTFVSGFSSEFDDEGKLISSKRIYPFAFSLDDENVTIQAFKVSRNELMEILRASKGSLLSPSPTK